MKTYKVNLKISKMRILKFSNNLKLRIEMKISLNVQSIMSRTIEIILKDNVVIKEWATLSILDLRV